MNINITGLNWVDVLRALYDEAPVGVRSLHFTGELSVEEATKLLSKKEIYTSSERYITFNYVHGRPIRVRFVENGDKCWLERCQMYDHTAGGGACARVIHKLKLRTMRGIDAQAVDRG